ncbi:hypothetical protein D781_4026 [Sporocytophaga myxococcoides]|uniref:Uncharacterized protein n=1 Tax=Sporocytophaga myxococcoides TaxID=153721 RepID=A0A098LMR7_9BACT|nr:hypothetical protein [Sporocytophaga myxococcoides]GAL87794.1 hypothetical protein D781_4026 [Sporocytophaga myxococcoides]
MIKEYFLLFASKKTSVDELAFSIYKKLDLEFTQKESLYVGIYNCYSGLYADKLTVEYNYVNNEWKFDKYQDYSIIIKLANFTGKNKDKESKTKHLKERLIKIEDIILLEESIIEKE